jgi:hypothetical protein
MAMLKSRDPKIFEDQAFAGGIKLLDQQCSMANDKVAICSFPRSGNSFLRRLIEQCTGFSTGSSISLHTATSLQI